MNHLINLSLVSLVHLFRNADQQVDVLLRDVVHRDLRDFLNAEVIFGSFLYLFELLLEVVVTGVGINVHHELCFVLNQGTLIVTILVFDYGEWVLTSPEGEHTDLLLLVEDLG